MDSAVDRSIRYDLFVHSPRKSVDASVKCCEVPMVKQAWCPLTSSNADRMQPLRSDGTHADDCDLCPGQYWNG